jgi:hypothetical protein
LPVDSDTKSVILFLTFPGFSANELNFKMKVWDIVTYPTAESSGHWNVKELTEV